MKDRKNEKKQQEAPLCIQGSLLTKEENVRIPNRITNIDEKLLRVFRLAKSGKVIYTISQASCLLQISPQSLLYYIRKGRVRLGWENDCVSVHYLGLVVFLSNYRTFNNSSDE